MKKKFFLKIDSHKINKCFSKKAGNRIVIKVGFKNIWGILGGQFFKSKGKSSKRINSGGFKKTKICYQMYRWKL
jgi:hypothetical protein